MVSDGKANLITITASQIKAFQYIFLKTTLLCEEKNQRASYFSQHQICLFLNQQNIGNIGKVDLIVLLWKLNEIIYMVCKED